MSNWDEDEEGYCRAAEDFQDARRVCDTLEIPLHRVSFAAEYRARVFEDFLTQYRAGRTPNPDVLCNREIKFGACLDYARRLGGELLATGHYARISHDGGRWRLLKGIDPAKDQSYFLHSIESAVLPHVLFPVGHLTKPAVRRIAREAVLPVFDKKDSAGICFIGERPFREFLSRYLPAQPGDIETPTGKVVGRHHGLMYYTLGQRQGLGIGGIAGSGEAAWYVARKEPARNALVVVQGDDHPLLYAAGLTTGPIHWLSPQPPGKRMNCTVRTRYRQKDQACTVELMGSSARITFESPQRAVTPGQFAVFYAGDECLGGAVIEAAIESHVLAATPRALPASMPI
jgi:tRNA-specific 2-thiouridylase